MVTAPEQIHTRIKQFHEDRNRQWFLFHLAKLYQTAGFFYVIKTSGEILTEPKEPHATLIKTLQEQLSDYDKINYPDLISTTAL